jgi:hypothetical protein
MDRIEQHAPILRTEVPLGPEQAGDRGDDGGQRRPQVVGDRGEQGRPQTARLRVHAGLLRFVGEPYAHQRECHLAGERPQDAQLVRPEAAVRGSRNGDDAAHDPIVSEHGNRLRSALRVRTRHRDRTLGELALDLTSSEVEEV